MKNIFKKSIKGSLIITMAVAVLQTIVDEYSNHKREMEFDDLKNRVKNLEEKNIEEES